MDFIKKDGWARFLFLFKNIDGRYNNTFAKNRLK